MRILKQSLIRKLPTFKFLLWLQCSSESSVVLGAIRQDAYVRISSTTETFRFRLRQAANVRHFVGYKNKIIDCERSLQTSDVTRTSTRTSGDGCPKLFPISDNVSVVIQEI